MKNNKLETLKLKVTNLNSQINNINRKVELLNLQKEPLLEKVKRLEVEIKGLQKAELKKRTEIGPLNFSDGTQWKCKYYLDENGKVRLLEKLEKLS